MDNSLASSKTKNYFYFWLLIIVLMGVYLRLDQFSLQVLLDDEWHAVHQLLHKSPGEFYLSLGHADFSIPLTLFYWVEMHFVGLNELGMRWPMLLAGIIIIPAFPLYIRPYLGDKIALLFSFFLAVSPLLIIYSRTARPYSLTLILSMLALAYLYRFVATQEFNWKVALVYLLSAVLCIWLHMISLPFVTMGFLTLSVPLLKQKNWRKLQQLFILGLVTLALLLILLLPPLLAHPEAVSSKMGHGSIDLSSLYAAGFAWYGVRQASLFLAFLVFFIIGLPRLWRQFSLTTPIILATFMTLIIIQYSQPDWVQHGITLARYILGLLPLLLLGSTVGMWVVADYLSRKWPAFGHYFSFLIFTIFLGWMLLTSPVRPLLAQPNSYSTHLIYQLNFSQSSNAVVVYQDENFHLSPFWKRLALQPPESMKIAVAPFYFESYNWDAPRWEALSGQRVIPAFLNNFCVESRPGEVPPESRIKLKNATFAGLPEIMRVQNVDILVYTLPLTVHTGRGAVNLGMDTAECEQKLRDLMPAPLYEDQWLIAFPLNQQMRLKADVKR